MKPMVVDLKKHAHIKNNLLSMIEAESADIVKNNKDNLKSDYFIRLEKNNETEYFTKFWKECEPEVTHIVNNIIGYPLAYVVDNYWYQQYNNSGHHSWHFHPKTFWNFVYYLETPKDGPGTEFFSPFFKTKFNIFPKEGDLLFFPSQYLHRSPQNNSSDRKTIIAFNISYDANTELLINL